MSNYRYLFILAIIHFAHCNLYSQIIEWEKTNGSPSEEFPEHISLTNDNQLLIASNSMAFASAPTDMDFWLVKADNDSGEIIWEESFGGDRRELLVSSFQTSDGGYILGGWSESGISKDKNENGRGGRDYWIIKLREDRSIEWQKTYGGPENDLLTSMIQTPDGGYLLAGDSKSPNGGEKSEGSRGKRDLWIIKIDAAGTIEWDVTYGGQQEDRVAQVLVASDGGYLVAAHSNSGIGGDKTEAAYGITGAQDFWILKISETGALEWQRTIGGEKEDELRCATNTDDGGYIISGTSKSGISGDKDVPIQSITKSDAWVLKIDVNGAIVWQKAFGTDGNDWPKGVHQSSDGGFFIGISSNGGIVGPKTEEARGDLDYWGVKIDGSGTLLWEKTVGGSGLDNAQDAIQTPDGGYLIAGFSQSAATDDKSEPSNGPSWDLWLVKLRYCEPESLTAFSNSPVCSSNPLKLSATGGVFYEWTGPNGFSSNLREPEIPNADRSLEGTYSVTISVDEFCSEVKTTEVVFEESPVLSDLGELGSVRVCDEDEDGLFGWDSSNLETDLLNGQQGVTLEYYDEDQNPLPYPFPNPYENDQAGPETITVRAFFDTNPGCVVESTFTLVPEVFDGDGCGCDEEAFTVSSNSPVCVDDTLSLSAAGGETYSWTGPNGFTSDEPNPEISLVNESNFGLYTVDILVDDTCFATLTTEVLLENSPNLIALDEIKVCDDDHDGFFRWDTSNLENELLNGQQNITLEYFDANFEPLPSPLPNPYTNTTAGETVINVLAYSADSSGCIAEQRITLVPEAFVGEGCISEETVAFPQFFTPNGDGSNDRWYVSSKTAQELESVAIFDRYGRILSFLNGLDLSWNGTFQGRRMPSDTYWYTAKYKTGKSKTGYFALKR